LAEAPAGRPALNEIEDMLAYAMACSLLGESLSEQELVLLRQVDAAGALASAALHLGRTNVLADIEASGGESLIAVLIIRKLQGELMKSMFDRTRLADAVNLRQLLDPLHQFDEQTSSLLVDAAVVAACAKALQAGNCGEFMALGAALQAPTLEEGQDIEFCGAMTPFAHSWHQVNDAGRELRVSGDRWSRGPAVKSEHARFNSRNDDAWVEASLGRDEARLYAAVVTALHQHLSRSAEFNALRTTIEADVRANFNRSKEAYVAVNGEFIEAPSILSDEFVAAVHDKAERIGKLRVGAAAAAIGRDKFGQDVRSATAPRVMNAFDRLIEQKETSPTDGEVRQ